MAKGAPKPDKRIGEAALLSAQTGQQLLEFMKGQSAIANAWATEDRARSKSVFQPLQDKYIAAAQEGPDYGKVDADVRRATADAAIRFDAAQEQEDRRLAAVGVRPDSGRAKSATRASELAEAAATTGAANTTRLASRTQAEAEADAKLTNAINMGSGLQVNPATSLGIATNSGQAGYQGAMQGYGQMGNLLNTQWQQQMAGWQADQASKDSLWGGVGSLVGVGAAMLSSKDAKTGKIKPRSVLSALKDMPVEEWEYKPGFGDGGKVRHVGPYAEDFKAATGKGDGKTIPVVDAIGVTMGAVQELSDKVDKIAKKGNRA